MNLFQAYDQRCAALMAMQNAGKIYRNAEPEVREAALERAHTLFCQMSTAKKGLDAALSVLMEYAEQAALSQPRMSEDELVQIITTTLANERIIGRAPCEVMAISVARALLAKLPAQVDVGRITQAMMENIWKQIGQPTLVADPKYAGRSTFSGVDMYAVAQAAINAINGGGDAQA